MTNLRTLLFIMAVLSACLLVNLEAQFVARDPGPRGGKVGAGQPIYGLTATEKTFFENGLTRFLEIDSVGGTLPGETGMGLGPTFNANQCASCHSQPGDRRLQPQPHGLSLHRTESSGRDG